MSHLAITVGVGLYTMFIFMLGAFVGQLIHGIVERRYKPPSEGTENGR